MNLPRFSLEGKTAIVTSGSRGIGEATAIELARAGADIVVASRKLAELARVAAEIEKLGKRALAVETYVGRMDHLQPLVDKIIKEFGTIDILVNNGGTSNAIPAIDYTEKAGIR